MPVYSDYLFKTFITFIGQTINKLRGLILIPMIVKNTDISIYGQFILTMMTLSFLTGISSFGTEYVVCRALPSITKKEEKQNAFYSQLFFNLLSIILLYLVLLPFGQILLGHLQNVKTTYILIFVFLILQVIFSRVADYFRFSHKIKSFNIFTVGNSVLSLLLILAFIVLKVNISLNILLFAHLLSITFIMILISRNIYHEVGFKFYYYRKTDLIKNIKIGFPLRIKFIMEFFLTGSDRYIIAVILSSAAVGFYIPAYSIGSLILIIPMISGIAMLPIITKLADTNNNKELQIVINSTIKGFLIVSIPFVAGGILYGEPILKLLTTPQIAKSSAEIIPIIATGSIFWGLIEIISKIFFVIKKTKLITIIYSVGVLLNVILNVVLLKIFKNVYYASISMLISYLTIFVLTYIISKKYAIIQIKINYLIKIIFAMLVMFLFLQFCPSDSALLSAFLGCMIYLFIILLLKTFSNKELKIIKSAFIKHKNKKLFSGGI